MQTLCGAAMGTHAGANRPVSPKAPLEEPIILHADEVLAELIAEHCGAHGVYDLAAAVRISHFAIDLFIHQAEGAIARMKGPGRRIKVIELSRQIDLAHTVRNKLSKLHDQCIELEGSLNPQT